jgi:hypothetical protein
MSAPTTGPSGLTAQEKNYHIIGIVWDVEQDPCELTADLYRVYKLEGRESDGKIVKGAGSLVGETTDPFLVDLISYNVKGHYSYAISAVYQGIESEPTTGKFIYL